MSLPKADFGVHGVCYCKDVPSKEARVSHACQRWARRNNIFAFVKIVPSINDAQTNVKNDDRRRETHGLRVSRSAGISIVARAVYGKDARYKQGMTGRSMAARASRPRPPVYRTPLSTESGATLWNGSSTLTRLSTRNPSLDRVASRCPHWLLWPDGRDMTPE